MHPDAISSSSTPNAAVISPPQDLLVSLPSLKNTVRKDRSNLNTVLDTGISSMALAKESMPIDAAKPVFIVVGGLLVMIQDMLSNDEALEDILLHCADICIRMYRATLGKRGVEINQTTLAAIEDLHRTVGEIHTKVEKLSRRSWRIRLVSSKTNKKTIAGWQDDLDRSLHVFNTELTLCTNVVVGQMAQDFREMKERSEIQVTVDKSPTKSPKLPPPPPEIFFGRDELVESIVGFSTKEQHIALIGLGGIGKTSVSKKVLNSPVVAAYFAVGRHFVSCDGFAISLESFVTRVASAVGASITSTDPLASLSTFLASLPTPILVVLDNAESVLDAEDAGSRVQITHAIEEIGSHRNVTLIVTTRNKSLPNNLRWKRVVVEPLELDAARDAFFAAYNDESPSMVADPLLNAVGCHALSVNLLAVAGAQNEWTIQELQQRWEEEKTRVLDLDEGDRMQSLSASIRLSLNSRTLRELGDKALEVMRVIAFLPQGVDKNKLQELFPTIPDIRRITDATNRLSLTYLNGAGFVTMLAPIRLHTQHTSPPIPSLLPCTRKFYFKKLDDIDGVQAKWIASEDDNVERLVVHALSNADDLEAAIRACRHFLYALCWNKPRTTTLTPMVRALAEVDDTLYWQVDSLWMLGSLARRLGRYAEATELLESARQVATAHGHKSLAAQCSFSIGDLEIEQSDYPAAESSYQDALKEYQEIESEDGVALCNERLGDVETRQGNLTEASRYLSEALIYREKEPDSENAGYVRAQLGALEFKQGNHAEGRRHFEAALAIFTKLNVDRDLGWCLREYALAEQASQDWVTVLDLHKRAQQSYNRANDVKGVARCHVERGQIFLYQRELALAKRCFEQAQGGFEKLGTADHVADCLRGLGEVAYLEKDDSLAERLFAQARSLYDSAGYVPLRSNLELLDDLRWDYW